MSQEGLLQMIFKDQKQNLKNWYDMPDMLMYKYLCTSVQMQDKPGC